MGVLLGENTITTRLVVPHQTKSAFISLSKGEIFKRLRSQFSLPLIKCSDFADTFEDTTYTFVPQTGADFSWLLVVPKRKAQKKIIQKRKGQSLRNILANFLLQSYRKTR